MRPLILSLALATPAAAQDLLSEVSGNWAGPSNQGVYFRAELSQLEETAGLKIWAGYDTPATDLNLDFDNDRIALSAYATSQRLEVVDTADGSVLQVITEYADEEGEGTAVLSIQFRDFQYAVVGYSHHGTSYNPGGDPVPYDCDVDLSALPTEDTNASDWSFNTPFDRGYCPMG